MRRIQLKWKAAVQGPREGIYFSRAVREAVIDGCAIRGANKEGISFYGLEAGNTVTVTNSLVSSEEGNAVICQLECGWSGSDRSGQKGIRFPEGSACREIQTRIIVISSR